MVTTSLLRKAAALGFVALAVTACSSGQTGSPSCPAATACSCDHLAAPGITARVRAQSVVGGELWAEVVEVIGPSQGAQLEPGDQLAGLIADQGPPCSSGAALAIEAGDELLTYYHPGMVGGFPNCEPFHACAAQRCEQLGEAELEPCWQTCTMETEQACDELRQAALLAGDFSWLVPWGDELDLGGGRVLLREELDVITDYDRCLAAYPPPPNPPCDDTIEYGACALTSEPAPKSGGLAVAAMLALAASAGLLRRRAFGRGRAAHRSAE